MDFLKDAVLPRVLGAIVMGYGLWFIPRNWLRITITRSGGSWSMRRIWRLLCWTLIVLGYLITGVTLLSKGWRTTAVSATAFAVAMLAFIPVPCHFEILNKGRWRIVRAILFTMAAAIAVAISLRA